MSTTADLSPDEQDAFDALLPAEQRTGDLAVDLAEAARHALARRATNYRHAGVILAALHRELGSWRKLGATLDIPQATARRWSLPPWRPPRQISHYDDTGLTLPHG